MKYHGLLLLLSLLVMPLKGQGQRYNFKSYSVNNGLPHGEVHSIVQTDDGYVWAGTYGGGVAKFEGEAFRAYTTEDGLKDNSIEVMFTDSRQNLWVSTYRSGVARLEGDRFVYPINDATLDTAEVYAIGEMADGTIWIGAYRAGIYRYDGGVTGRITTDDGLLHNTTWDFYEARDGAVWIATSAGVSVMEPTRGPGQETHTFTNYTTEEGISGASVYRIAEHPSGDLWMATSSGITVWDGSSFSVIREAGGITLNYVYDLLIDEEGTVWVGTYSQGVVAITGEGTVHYDRHNGLNSNYIYDLYEDSDGNIWVATAGSGINLLQSQAFTFYGVESGIAAPNVYALLEDRSGRVWVGTEDGIYVRSGAETFRPLPMPARYESPKEVWDIAELPGGDILFLMPDNAIYRYDGNALTNYSERHGLDYWYTFDLFAANDNSLWIGTDTGLYHKQGNRLRHFTSGGDGLASNIVYQIFPHRGFLWIATYYGISRYDGTGFMNFTTKDGIGHPEILFITDGPRGNLWLGTGGGITLLELSESGEVTGVKNFGKETGMELVTTQSLWFDADGMLWQGTNGGMHRLDVPGYWRTGQMDLMHYPLSEKGIGIETNQLAVIERPGNRAWIGTAEGILELRPDDMEPPDDDIRIHMTDIQRNSQQIDWSAFSDTLRYRYGQLLYPGARFAPGQHTYAFSYEATVYGNTSNKRYRYKLEGFEDEWSAPTRSETAVFTNLSPGKYQFVVQARNGTSAWSANEARFSFRIDFPFWRTYWFYALMILGLAGLLYTYTRVRLNRLEKQRLKELVEEQTAELKKALEEKEVLIKEIHHRVKNNLAVIAGLLELQIGYADDEFSARVLNESQRRVHSISMIHEKLYQSDRLAEIDFRKYIRELVDVITHSYRSFEKDIAVELDVEQVKLGVNQGIPCGLIINELISNAYEHAFKGRSKGTIRVTFMQHPEGQVTFTVSDDGVGLPPDFEENRQQMSSLGLVLVDTLTQQLDGTCRIERCSPGTRIIVSFEREAPAADVPFS